MATSASSRFTGFVQQSSDGVRNVTRRAGAVAKSQATSFVTGFKAFILRGNVVEIGVGLVIATAFTAVVTSFVNDIISPPLGLLSNNDLKLLFVVLRPPNNATAPVSYLTADDAKQAGAVVMTYGAFISAIINFILTGIALYVIIYLVRSMTFSKTAAPTEKECPYCCKNVPIKAKRCAFCTSALPDEDSIDKQESDHLQIPLH